MCNRSFQSKTGGYSYSYSYSTSSSCGNKITSSQNWVTSDLQSGPSIESALENLAIQDTGNFEEDALAAHNEYRAKHGVVPLELSRDLCKYASEWANNLAARGVMQHRSNNKYGENIYAKYGSGPISVTGSEPVKSWYDEIKDYNFNSPGFAGATGHFTQVVWRESKKLGIAQAKNNKGQIFVVANYDPPGNYQGQFGENVPRVGAMPVNSVKCEAKNDTVKVQSTNGSSSQNLSGFNEFEIECLNVHNKYRTKHKAPPLTLNKNLCQFAQEWANNLAARGVMQHRSNNSYGENIYAKYGTGNIQVAGNEPVDSWYSEIKDYNFNAGKFSSGTGHFTQVVWKGSRELGVGIAKNSKGQIFVVANYDPAGNYQGQFKENVLR
uniref:CSON000338 protein n=1 Tax=Culicoides sonorensis TaxID=179676 RepID=A0A336LPQ9_CULSO